MRMPKKGNSTASDSNFKEPKPVPRIKLFKEERLSLFDILKDAEKPLHQGKMGNSRPLSDARLVIIGLGTTLMYPGYS